MDTIVECASEEAVPDLIEWSAPNQELVNNNNSTFLYIAVEYVKGDLKMEGTPTVGAPPDTYADFDPHVSPLDPNMSSVARYSPVYNDPPSTEYNPVVIHQLVQPEAPQFNPSLEPPPVLCNDNNYLPNQPPENEQQIELLITDQTTGVWYSVRGSQEFLVERCLEDEQLLNALTPDPLLDADLLTLDENTLKSELNDELTSTVVDNVVNNYMSTLDQTNDIKDSPVKKETRKTTKPNVTEYEDQILSKVYSIVDKPVPSRARATLPEGYLVINKVDDHLGVFAKKTIAQRTQFGPLMGVVVEYSEPDPISDKLQYLVENVDGVAVDELDVSDENTSNWMGFVRKANNYSEQNVVVSQEGRSLYFTTTKNILAKQELKVGYSLSYAKRHKLPVFSMEVENSWPCYECSATFPTSEELQKHLNIHDDNKDENVKPKKKFWKNKKKPISKSPSEALKCNECSQVFMQSGKLALKHHLMEKHTLNKVNAIEDHFSVILNYKCENCNVIFNNEALLKIHNNLHDNDSSEELTNHVCPSCLRKFPTQRQLVSHVSSHVVSNVKVTQPETFKCNVCHKIFALRERLRRHMLVHEPDESKPLQCKQCNKRFLNNSALAGHLKTHFVGKKVFECPICKESFDHVLKLKLHVPNHCENNLYSCPHCTKVFKKYAIIRKHIRAFHCDLKHQCPHCTKMFPTLDKLRMHLLRHSDHREFLCADCGKQFKRKDKLKEHCQRLHSEERENDCPRLLKIMTPPAPRKMNLKVEPTDFHRFIYKCHTCLVGFKRRGMLVNHLAKRHPDIPPDSVPELNLPILQTTRDYYCQHCDKVYKSSSKRKAHILKNHPGAALPMSNRKQGNFEGNLPNPTFSQTVGSITTIPQSCNWCHKQYASKAKLLQHQRKKHSDELKQLNYLNEDKSEQPLPIEEITIVDNCLSSYKVTDILNNEIGDFDRNSGQYNFVAINTHEDFPTQPNELVNNDVDPLSTPNSHLFRLLTTSNDLVPPR